MNYMLKFIEAANYKNGYKKGMEEGFEKGYAEGYKTGKEKLPELINNHYKKLEDMLAALCGQLEIIEASDHLYCSPTSDYERVVDCGAITQRRIIIKANPVAYQVTYDDNVIEDIKKFIESRGKTQWN